MALRHRATAAMVKGATMGLFGLWVLGVTAWHVWHGTLPQALTMGAVGSGGAVRQRSVIRSLMGSQRR
jgi:hypothetical protein